MVGTRRASSLRTSTLQLRSPRVSLTISSSIASPASTSCSSVMRGAAPLRRDCAVARQQRHMHERGERRAVVAAGRLDRPPAQVIAEIAAGIARGAGIDAGAVGGTQQFCGVRAEHHGVGIARDRSLAHPRVIGIRPQRGDGVAGAGLDPQVGRSGSQAEHQQRMRAMLRQQFRQFAIHRACRSPGKYALTVRPR